MNGKIYVGSAKNLRKRKNEHFTKLRNNNNKSSHLQNAWNKYGEHNFDFEILQFVKNEKDLINCEQFWIDKTNCNNKKYGYNIRLKARSNLGIKYDPEAGRKISKANKGRKWSIERRLRITGKNNHNYGIKLSDEHRKKLSLKRKGSNNSKAKLNELQVKIIRSLMPELNSKTITRKDLMKYFNISKTNIGVIIRNESWTHI